MTSKADIEKRIATMGDPKSNGKWAEHYEKVQKQKRIDNHTMQQWGLNKKPAPDAGLKNLVKFGVHNSPVSVSKAPQGSKQHRMEVENHINKVVADNVPKIADQEIFKNNINRKPRYPTQATPQQVGQLAERLEKSRQMAGQESMWDSMKRTAKTPQEKQEIRDIIKKDYKNHGAKDMADSDLKWIGKSKYAPLADFKIDASGISTSINNYINTSRVNAPVAPPKKQRDPDLNLGLASILGETYDS